MATNNYFGFTHTGTQYSTPAATYQTGQSGYAVTHTQPYNQSARPAQTGYEGYQTSHPTGTYGFTARQQAAPPPPPAATTQTYDTYSYQRPSATTYDGTKTYYQQQPQTNKAYTQNATYSNANRANNAPKSAANNQSYYGQSSVSTSYPTNYNSSNASTPTTTAATYSGYDAALYSAATMYVQQQQQASSGTNSKQPNNWATFKKPGMKMNKPKQPPKPQQLHYCDVCKISCAGPQTYREHLEGQKHKKKEAAAKAGTAALQTTRPGNSLRCELCDVTCTGSDAYAAHIRGAKHQKVVKLHTKLGKPIPSTEPTVVGATNSPGTSAAGSAPVTPVAAANASNAPANASPANAVKKAVATPKITFVGGTKLSTTAPTNPPSEVKPIEQKLEESADENMLDLSKLEDKSDIQPVGQDYIEEIKNEEGKVISFQCKLCECRFNDPNAKEMHMKGRRHRLQYKKKVNPELVVDIKPSLRQRKIQEEKMRRQQMKEEFWRRRDEERWREEMRMMEEEERHYWEERRRYEEEMEYYEWSRRFGRDPRGMVPPPQMMRPPFPGQPGPGAPPMPPRRPDTLDDRHVLAKHSQIYPKEEELQAVQKIVSNTEKALKQVSDFLVEVEVPKADAKIVVKEEEKESKEEDGAGTTRILKGVMRVGVLAKGLLLRGDTSVNLVVLCSEKPTKGLLFKVGQNLPEQLKKVAEEKYETRCSVEDACIYVTSGIDPKITVTITLTSPVVREPSSAEEGENVTIKDPPDVLDRQKCLAALAALRHAKWFQARASGLQSCVLIIRILRDLCQRVPTWTPLNNWAMELLVEKVLCSAGIPLSPGDSLRRVLEAIASGVLLPGGPGLLDPCEKDPTDASANMTDQEREDITASAQHALRLLAFRQIHKVLGMDPLPVPKFPKGRFTRKRRRDNSSGEGAESEGADGKKDKKDDSEVKMDAEPTPQAAA